MGRDWAGAGYEFTKDAELTFCNAAQQRLPKVIACRPARLGLLSQPAGEGADGAHRPHTADVAGQ